MRTHALGTYVLLEAARERGLRYVQVSTDEVYGSIEEGSFTEELPAAPLLAVLRDEDGRRSACAELLPHLRAAERCICRGSNNYGPYQYPEKLIPLMVLNALHGDGLPVYGDGMQVRNWIHATDFARAIGHVLDTALPGEVYNAGGPDECANIDVVQRIIALHGRSGVADRARHRPPRARPPLLALLREGPRARLDAAGAL